MFSKRAAENIHTLQTDYGEFKIQASKRQHQVDKQPTKVCKHNCGAVEVKFTSGSARSPAHRCTRQSLMLQTPIIIQKKSHGKSFSANRNLGERVSNWKKIQPFVPIAIPTRGENRLKIETPKTDSTCRQKEIQIFIDNETEDKECLKKLFKKVHTLTDQLAHSEAERVRLNLELDHLGRKDLSCREHQRLISRLEGDKYKLEMENEVLKRKARLYDSEVPKESFKELVLQKPVEVKVQIPKYIAGPERIVERIVQIPKYIEIEKKVPQIIIKEIKVPEIVQRQVFIDKPVYKDPIIVDKPVFVEKPVYIDRPVEVEKKVQVEVPVEIEVPVYIDRPIMDEDWLRRFSDLQDELGAMMRENQVLKSENHSLKMTVNKLQTNLDMLNSHNREKNREVEFLLSNRGDYLPVSQEFKGERAASALDRTSSTLSPRSHHHLRYL